MSVQTKSTKMLNRTYKMLYQCDHCDYERNYKYNFRKHAKFQHEPTCCSSHCDYKKSDRKYMKNRHARKSDMTVEEVRNIINEGFDAFSTLYAYEITIN